MPGILPRSYILIMIFLFLSTPICLAAHDAPSSADDIPRITIPELQRMQEAETVVMIDTRTQGQWQQASDKIPGAMRVSSREDLLQLKNTLSADTAIVTYCT